MQLLRVPACCELIIKSSDIQALSLIEAIVKCFLAIFIHANVRLCFYPLIHGYLLRLFVYQVPILAGDLLVTVSRQAIHLINLHFIKTLLIDLFQVEVIIVKEAFC